MGSEFIEPIGNYYYHTKKWEKDGKQKRIIAESGINPPDSLQIENLCKPLTRHVGLSLYSSF